MLCYSAYMSSNGFHGILPALAWTAAACALAWFVWAMFWDRARGRKRCPKCWYDMAGVDCKGEAICPECGRTISKPSKLRKTRRRWLSAALATVVVVSSTHIGLSWSSIRQHGWIAAIPSSVLVFIAPVGEDAWAPPTWAESPWPFDDPANALLVESIRRADAGELASWQFSVFLDRVHDGMDEYPDALVMTRDTWAEGLPVRALLWRPWFLQPNDATYFRARVAGSSDWAVHYEFKSGAVTVGVVPEGVKHVDIEYELWINGELRYDGVDPTYAYPTELVSGSGRRVWKTTARRIAVASSAEGVMKAFVDDQAAGRFQGSLRPSFVIHPSGEIRFGLRRSGWHLTKTQEDWALGVRVEILRRGKVVGRADALYPMIPPNTMASMGSSWEHYDINWVGAPPTRDEIDVDEWTFRMTGDPAIAILDYRRDSYWSGSITTPSGDVVDLNEWDLR